MELFGIAVIILAIAKAAKTVSDIILAHKKGK